MRSKRRGPQLFVYVRGDVALVTGDDALAIASRVADPEWSPAGRGWVIPAVNAADVVAYATEAHMLAVLSDLDAKAAS